MGAAMVVRVFYEDHESFRQQEMSAALRGAGCEVVASSSTQEVLIACEREHPDLVLLAIDQHRRRGLTTLRLIRMRYRIPVIVLSSGGQKEHIAQALAFGADDYITWPTSGRVAAARVFTVLRRYGALRTMGLPQLAIAGVQA